MGAIRRDYGRSGQKIRTLSKKEFDIFYNVGKRNASLLLVPPFSPLPIEKDDDHS